MMEIEKKDILSEISLLTRTIEEQYPELQKYLGESRSTLPQGDTDQEMDKKSLEDYRDSLKNLIKGYNSKIK